MTENYKNQSDKFLHSSYYEKLVEHLFIADILTTAWLNGQIQIEVSRAEIDNSGYDLVLECNKIIRHVQLKCSDENSKTSRQKINIKLFDKPSGCVIWIKRSIDKTHPIFLLNYLFFGNNAGEPLSSEPLSSLDKKYKSAKHTKANAVGEKKSRPNIKLVNKGSFNKIKDTKELLNKLFNLIIE